MNSVSMNRKVAALVVALVALAGLPAGAAESTVLCGPDDGRERLTVDGFEATFDAPAVTYPGLATPADTGVGPTQDLRSAPFPFTLDLAPAASANVQVSLDWSALSDFDFFVFDDATGAELTRGAEDNTADGSTSELATFVASHCQQITIAVRSWAGNPGETLDLDVSVTPRPDLLSCAADDPAPNCEGKAEGDAPEPSAEDVRTRLYMGGEAPGQASMLWRYGVGLADNPVTQSLPRTTLSEERPTGGVPDGHTRVLSGFRTDNATAWGNPFIPHWTHEFDEPTAVVGDVTAMLWASSRTMDATGTLYFDLWADGGLVQSVEVAGEEIGENPTRLAVTFTDLNRANVRELSLQVATEAVVTTAGGEGNPADAEVTVHYGSVQFPSFLSLP